MPEFSATSWIIATISFGLVVLLVVAYTVQTIERNNRERRRLETALKLRSNEFHELLEALPASMLGRDLRLLICQGLEDVYQQLRSLGSSRVSGAELDQTQALLASVASEPEQAAYQPLGNAQQIKEVQRQLKQLYEYLLRLRSTGRLSQAQAQQHVRQLQHLLVLTSLDGYQLASQQAVEADKPRLAIHYLQLALERMQKQNPGGVFDARIEQTQVRIASMEQSEAVAPTTTATAGDGAANAWNEFEQDKEGWKKKTLYD